MSNSKSKQITLPESDLAIPKIHLEDVLRIAVKNYGKAITKAAPISLDMPKIHSPVVMTSNMAIIWIRLEHPMRWLILDHLRRYAQYVEEGLSKKGERSIIKITHNNGLFLAKRGNIEIEYKEDHYRIAYKSNSGKIENTDIQHILNKNDIMAEPNSAYKMPILSHGSQKAYHPAIIVEPAAEIILKRVPEAIREELKQQIALNQMICNMTNPLGDSQKKNKKGLGFTTYKNQKQMHIMAHGNLGEGIYFQKGRLMLKAEKLNMPETLWASIKVGEKVESFVKAKINDAQNHSINVFEGLIITKIYEGVTNEMGRHKALEMGKDK